MNFGPGIKPLQVMLNMQNELNNRIDTGWLVARYDWHRALMMEACEALDHYGWKWWKAQPAPTGNAQIQLELVDMWHFVLSIALQNADGIHHVAAQRMHEAFSHPPTDVLDAHPRNLLDNMIGHAARKRVSTSSFMTLMQQFDLSWERLYKIYVAKNVLNTFRQDHGYAQGTYRKTWGGKEDNEVLAELMEREPNHGPGDLRKALEGAYKGSS